MRAKLIRFVRGPDGAVVPDLDAQAAGPRRLGRPEPGARRRGGQAQGCSAAGFGEAVEAEPICPSVVGALLRKAALSYLSLAKKAGEAVAGAAKVEEMAGVAGGRGWSSMRARQLQNGRRKDRRASRARGRDR